MVTYFYSTPDGRDVISYSLFNTPEGSTVTHQIATLASGFDINQLPDAANQTGIFDNKNLPSITNAEVLSALDFARGVYESSNSDWTESSATDSGAIGAIESSSAGDSAGTDSSE